jgi:hypothetical protein
MVGNAWVDLVLCGLCSIRLLVLQFFEEILERGMWYVLTIVMLWMWLVRTKKVMDFPFMVGTFARYKQYFRIIWQLCSLCGCSLEWIWTIYACGSHNQCTLLRWYIVLCCKRFGHLTTTFFFLLWYMYLSIWNMAIPNFLWCIFVGWIL